MDQAQALRVAGEALDVWQEGRLEAAKSGIGRLWPMPIPGIGTLVINVQASADFDTRVHAPR